MNRKWKTITRWNYNWNKQSANIISFHLRV